MPSPLETSCSQEGIQKKSTTDEERRLSTCKLDWSNEDNDDVTSDDCIQSSSSSDCSPTHSHSPTISYNDDSINEQIAIIESENDSEHEISDLILNDTVTVIKWSKFKRKYRPVFHKFFKKLQIHLIMCFKFTLSTLLILATVQLRCVILYIYYSTFLHRILLIHL